MGKLKILLAEEQDSKILCKKKDGSVSK